MYRRELVQADLERMMIPSRYWNVKFAEISDEGNPSPRSIAHKYISKIDEMVSNGIGLLLWGANGRGKTGMAVCIAKELRRRGLSVLFFESASLKSAVIDKVAFDDEQSVWERAKNVDALVLDDLGKGVQDSTGFGARVIDELIRYRNARKMITFITTNMNTRQLGEELKISTMHSMKECLIPVSINGPDRRAANLEMISSILMET